MNNLPTLKDVVSFIKDNFKIIFGTMIISIALFAIGIGYTIYSNSIAGEVQTPTVGGVEGESISLTAEEVNKLQEDVVSFNFYVENDAAEPFINYNLLKKLLTAPDILQLIEESAGTEIKPAPEIAINVNLEQSTYILTLSIGTGNYEDNLDIAEAYYKGIQEKLIPFFENKHIYMESVPAKSLNNIVEGESTFEDGSTVSSKDIIIYGIIVLLISFVMGLIIAIFKLMTKKELDIFSYAYKDNDKILNLSNLRKNSEEEFNNKVVHAIAHPQRRLKLILTEIPLSNSLMEKITKELNVFESSIPSQIKKDTVIFADDISKIDPTLNVEEVNIVCIKNTTTKKWYQEQRIQLENYDTYVKIIQI